MQTKETVQQLGELQHLGRKAFPFMIGKVFDKVLPSSADEVAAEVVYSKHK